MQMLENLFLYYFLLRYWWAGGSNVKWLSTILMPSLCGAIQYKTVPKEATWETRTGRPLIFSFPFPLKKWELNAFSVTGKTVCLESLNEKRHAHLQMRPYFNNLIFALTLYLLLMISSFRRIFCHNLNLFQNMFHQRTLSIKRDYL